MQIKDTLELKLVNWENSIDIITTQDDWEIINIYRIYEEKKNLSELTRLLRDIVWDDYQKYWEDNLYVLIWQWHKNWWKVLDIYEEQIEWTFKEEDSNEDLDINK